MHTIKIPSNHPIDHLAGTEPDGTLPLWPASRTFTMKRTGTGGIRRKGVGPITLGRASRLHHLVSLLSQGIAERDILLKRLEMGIRTFYRELEMLKRCGVKVRRDGKTYGLKTSLKEAEGL